MKVGIVTGQVVATLKHAHLEALRLLVVQPESLAGCEAGAALIAVDRLGAGVGERVLLVDDGSAARGLYGRSGPIRAMIVGIVDEVHTDADS